jgi:hypothetical protein
MARKRLRHAGVSPNSKSRPAEPSEIAAIRPASAGPEKRDQVAGQPFIRTAGILPACRLEAGDPDAMLATTNVRVAIVRRRCAI